MGQSQTDERYTGGANPTNQQVTLSAPIDAYNTVLTSGVQGLHEDPTLISRVESEVRNFSGTGNLEITMTTEQSRIWNRLATECNVADQFRVSTPQTVAAGGAGMPGANEKAA